MSIYLKRAKELFQEFCVPEQTRHVKVVDTEHESIEDLFKLENENDLYIYVRI